VEEFLLRKSGTASYLPPFLSVITCNNVALSGRYKPDTENLTRYRHLFVNIERKSKTPSEEDSQKAIELLSILM
jgi:hypothetical protein